MTRLTRLALRAYPPYFRDRYGSELEALVEDSGTYARTIADLAIGATRAWIRPTFVGSDHTRRRLQASVATIWATWCTSFLVIPAVNWALLDPPTRSATNGVHTLLDVAYVMFFAGWALSLLGGLPLIVRCVAPAMRNRNWTALRPLLPAVMLGLIEVAGLLVIGIARVGNGANPGWAQRAGIALWLVGLVVFVIALGLGPAASLTRMRPETSPLRFPAALAVLLAVTLTVATACSLAAATIGHPTLAGSAVPVWLAIGVAGVGSTIALGSSARAVRALAAR